jgi:WD40 repeat protein
MGGAVSSTNPHVLRRRLLIKLHNALREKQRNNNLPPISLEEFFEEEFESNLVRNSSGYDGFIGLDAFVWAASVLGMPPPTMQQMVDISRCSGTGTSGRVNYCAFVDFLLSPPRRMLAAKQFDTATAGRFRAPANHLRTESIRPAQVDQPSPIPTSSKFAAHEAIASMRRLVSRHATELSASPALIFQLALNEPDATYPAQKARCRGSSQECGLRCVPHLSLFRKQQAIDPCLAKIDHAGEVTALAIFPCGSKCAIGGGRQLIVWDIASMACERELGGHDGDVMCVAISSNSKFLVSGDDEGELKVWALGSYRCLFTLSGHDGWVNACAVTNEVIVSGSEDESVRIWSLQTGECMYQLEEHDDVINCCAIAENTVVSGGEDKTAKVWDCISGECLQTLRGHKDSINGCAISIASGVATVATGSADRTIILWDIISGASTRVLQGHTGGIYCCSLSGSTLVSGSWDRSVRIWDSASGECAEVLTGHTGPVHCISVFGTTVASGGEDEFIKVWDFSSKTEHVETQHAAQVCCAIDSTRPELSRFVSGSWDKKVCIWGGDGSCLHTCEAHTDHVFCVDMYNDTVVSGGKDNTVRVWCLLTGKCEQLLEGHTSWVNCCAIEGTTIVSGSTDRTLKVWTMSSPRNWRCLHTLVGHHDWVYCCHISGMSILSGSEDRTVRVWNLQSGECKFVFKQHTAGVHSCCMQENLVVTGSDDMQAIVWDVTSGACLHKYIHTSPVIGCQLSPCSRWLYSCTTKELCIWSLGSGARVMFHPTPDVEPICSFAVSMDGTAIYSTKTGSIYSGAFVAADSSAVPVWEPSKKC